VSKTSAVAVALLLSLPVTAFGHRLDEYLVATILALDAGRVEGSMRLIPGAGVSSAVIASIDANGDQALSEDERQAYAQRVLRDLSLGIDGQPLTLHLVLARFPPLSQMLLGTGEIQLAFSADLSRRGGGRRLTFENHHQSDIAVYLVNCLVPRNDDIRITAQSRNGNQSVYQLDFEQGP
jgi:hypothetical protein